MKYRYNRAAGLEMLDAALYYEAQREGLGIEFADEVEIVAVADLRRRPGYWRNRLR